MLKLLNKETNNIFTLPDEEAMKIVQQDRKGTFVILDAGLQEESTEEVTEEVVTELLDQQEQRAEEIEKEDNPVEEVKAPNPKAPKITEDTLNLEKMEKKDLVAVARRLGVTANINYKKETIIEKIRETGVL